jgi:hypothetical protein
MTRTLARLSSQVLTNGLLGYWESEEKLGSKNQANLLKRRGRSTVVFHAISRAEGPFVTVADKVTSRDLSGFGFVAANFRESYRNGVALRIFKMS